MKLIRTKLDNLTFVREVKTIDVNDYESITILTFYLRSNDIIINSFNDYSILMQDIDKEISTFGLFVESLEVGDLTTPEKGCNFILNCEKLYSFKPSFKYYLHLINTDSVSGSCNHDIYVELIS